MIDYSTIIAERFEYILVDPDYKDKSLATMGFVDNAIYWIVGVRCESDINGPESVFEQLFCDNVEVENFISVLLKLNEKELANQFKLVADVLNNNAFWTETRKDITSLPANQAKIVVDILNGISDSQKLWELDDKLGKLLLDNSPGSS
jgi:hypothetical protein